MTATTANACTQAIYHLNWPDTAAIGLVAFALASIFWAMFMSARKEDKLVLEPHRDDRPGGT